MADVRSFPADRFREFDEARPTRRHWKIMFISGMGFFTDAYDLFIIGVVMAMLRPMWHIVIAAALGKLGGFVGVFTFPFLMHWHGLLAAESGAAIVSVLGLLTTSSMLPETKGRSLEELASEPEVPSERVCAA